ncbi:MAG: hypothetical protein QOE33_2953 [Acidobacteriota bacterium]|nr:hypothetical protein [Acidobacteriota bacterium]
MRKRLLRRTRLTNPLAILILSLVAIFPARQTTNAQSPTAPPFRVGEKLTYSVSFSNFPIAAHVQLYVAGRGAYFNRDGYELRAHVETIEQVRAALLALDNYYFIYVDPQTGLPYRARVTTGPTRPPPATPESSDPAPQFADITTLPSPADADVTPAVHDLISAVYSLRALPLAPGSVYPVLAQFEGTQYEAELRVTGRETIKTSAGSFNALATQVRVRKNRAVDDYRVQIYFSDDERRVPVLVTAHLRSGELRATLASDEMVLSQTNQQSPTIAPTPKTNNTPAPSIAQAPPHTTNTQRPAAPPALSDADPIDTRSPGDLPFNVGEQLNYNFYLGDSQQPVGTASFTVRSRGRYFNRDGLLITATMATNQALQNAFPVRDTIATYVSSSTLLPFRNELQIQEGTHRVQGVVSFDQERGTAVAPDGKTVEIPVGTYDFVSVLYALRSFDLTPPKRNAVSLLINKQPRTLFITSVSRDTIDLGSQHINAYQLALTTDDAQGNRFNLRLWVGTDRRRLPLRLLATTPLGPVRADLSIIPFTRQ